MMSTEYRELVLNSLKTLKGERLKKPVIPADPIVRNSTLDSVGSHLLSLPTDDVSHQMLQSLLDERILPEKPIIRIIGEPKPESEKPVKGKFTAAYKNNLLMHPVTGLVVE